MGYVIVTIALVDYSATELNVMRFAKTVFNGAIIHVDIRTVHID